MAQNRYVPEIINLLQSLIDVYNSKKHTRRRQEMRTNVVIDDALMESDLKVSGLRTKKDAIE